jgi:hypothetical protein
MATKNIVVDTVTLTSQYLSNDELKTALGVVNGTNGTNGTNGLAGPVGLDGNDGEEGSIGPQGIAGKSGSVGATGAMGIGFPGNDGDDGMDGHSIIGPQGTQGQTGSTGPQGVTAISIAFDGFDGDEGRPGCQGIPGVQGTVGPQGPCGPPVYLEAPEADEPFVFHGVQGNTGTQAPPLAFSGGLTTSTTINDTTTPTTGGKTLASQIANAGSVWRICAYGTFVAVSSATARNATITPYWGTTALPAIAVVVLISVAQTTNWVCEFELSASSTTAVWTAGWLQNKFDYPAIVAGTSSGDKTDLATPATTSVTAGAQTLDLRFLCP